MEVHQLWSTQTGWEQGRWRDKDAQGELMGLRLLNGGTTAGGSVQQLRASAGLFPKALCRQSSLQVSEDSKVAQRQCRVVYHVAHRVQDMSGVAGSEGMTCFLIAVLVIGLLWDLCLILLDACCCLYVASPFSTCEHTVLMYALCT